jgi:NADP-dependent 3-hydroxy acid dehydrogenase YdfG
MPSVLVTGAGRGIGLAITEHMSSRGWDVDATARSDAALHSLGQRPHVHPVSLDVTDRSAIAALPDLVPPSTASSIMPASRSPGPWRDCRSTPCPTYSRST